MDPTKGQPYYLIDGIIHHMLLEASKREKFNINITLMGKILVGNNFYQHVLH